MELFKNKTIKFHLRIISINYIILLYLSNTKKDYKMEIFGLGLIEVITINLVVFIIYDKLTEHGREYIPYNWETVHYGKSIQDILHKKVLDKNGNIIDLEAEMTRNCWRSFFTMGSSWHRIPWRIREKSDYTKEIKHEREVNRKARIKKSVIAFLILLIIAFFYSIDLIDSDILLMADVITFIYIFYHIFHIIFSIIAPRIHQSWVQDDYTYFWISSILTISISIVGFYIFIFFLLYMPFENIHYLIYGNGNIFDIFGLFFWFIGGIFIFYIFNIIINFVAPIIYCEEKDKNKLPLPISVNAKSM